jgi:hypothetical protein
VGDLVIPRRLRRGASPFVDVLWCFQQIVLILGELIADLYRHIKEQHRVRHPRP